VSLYNQGGNLRSFSDVVQLESLAAFVTGFKKIDSRSRASPKYSRAWLGVSLETVYLENTTVPNTIRLPTWHCHLKNFTMGRLRRSRAHHARRDVSRASRTRVIHLLSVRICSYPLFPRQEQGISIWFSSLISTRKYVESVFPLLRWIHLSRHRTGLLWRLSRLIWKNLVWASITAWNVQSVYPLFDRFSLLTTYDVCFVDTTKLTQLCARIGGVRFTSGGVRSWKSRLIRSRKRRDRRVWGGKGRDLRLCGVLR
jgi:hypothetical protein